MTLPQVPPHEFGLYSFSADTLYEALSNEFLPASEISSKPGARYLYKYLHRLGARLIIVEPAYIDAGYLDDYAAYYVKCFKTYDRSCKRIHFFSDLISVRNFLRIVDGKASKAALKRFTESYLGFVVARPLPDAIIGRTVLKTYEDNGRRNYTCIREYSANLFGIELTVESLAFQEQDTVMAACATVALWCAFNKTRDLFNSLAPTPAEITRVANRRVFQSRSIPSHGLNLQQMTNVIQHVGLEHEVFRVDNTIPFVSLVYAHLKWGLPVILAVEVEGIGKHAITLVGYSQREKPVREHELAKVNGEDVQVCPPMVGLRIDRLFAHDDRLGPFVRLDIEMREPTEELPMPVILRPKWPTDANHSKQTPAAKSGNALKQNKPPAIYPLHVIVPVYHKIRVTFHDVEKLLLKVTEVLRLIKPKKSIEWDLHLTTTNQYKSLIKLNAAIPESVKRRVLLEPKPKYFWRAVLAFEGRKSLELLADATDMSRSFPIFFAIWHNQDDKTTLHGYLEPHILKDATRKALGTSFLQFLREWSA